MAFAVPAVVLIVPVAKIFSDPPIRGTVAVYCDTLQINRRAGEASWEGWRLPFTAEDSPLLGGEDRLVAALCANVRSASSRGKPQSAPPMAGP